jgi:hypothetical protein
MVHGVRVTSPADTFVQMAPELNLVDLVVLGDTLIKSKAVTAEQLISRAGAASGRYAARLVRAASLVRTGVDSPMEARLRMLLVLAGLPEPVLNYIVRDERGTWLRRFDLAFPTVRVAIEYDGRHHVEREEQWHRDLHRREALESDEWRLVTVVSTGIYAEPARTLQRVTGALGTGGCAWRSRARSGSATSPAVRRDPEPRIAAQSSV